MMSGKLPHNERFQLVKQLNDAFMEFSYHLQHTPMPEDIRRLVRATRDQLKETGMALQSEKYTERNVTLAQALIKLIPPVKRFCVLYQTEHEKHHAKLN